ncbi:MAG: polyprenyl synthetase family protein [Oligoflexia bacterium]|nr:polyprenyl synthetase family protein [Oligoflexia bacterium]
MNNHHPKSFLEQFIPQSVLRATSDLRLDISVNQKNVDVEIKNLLNKSMFIGGKRLRPLLMFLFAKLYKIPLEIISPYALSAELIHLATLSHDDVIDNATTRRGIPSINILSSNKRAILTGDYLLAYTVFELCKFDNIRILQELSAVIKELALGEWMQLNLTEGKIDLPPKISEVEEIAKKKTASVISFCTIVPAILSKRSEKIIELTRSIGHTFGIAFQLSDDLLDFSSEEQTGKNAFNDLNNGTLNSVAVDFFNLHPKYWQRWIKNEFNIDQEIKNPEVYKLLEDSKSNIKKLIQEKKHLMNESLDNLASELECECDYKCELEKEIIESMKSLSEYIYLRDH